MALLKKDNIIVKGMYVCMLKVALAVLSMERGNQLGQGERSLSGPVFPTPRAKLARGTPPTAYYHQLTGSSAKGSLFKAQLTTSYQSIQSDQPGGIFESYEA